MAAQEGGALLVLVYGDFDWEPLAQTAQEGDVEAVLQRGAGSVLLPVDAAAWLDAIPLTVIVTP